LKNRVVIILAVLASLFFIGMVSSCNNALRQKEIRDKEMAARLQMEEKMSRFFQEKSALEEKVKAKESEAEEAKAQLEEARSMLAEEQMENQGLKEDLRKIGGK
jgi:Tfp pilus assembly protein PilE